MKKFGRQAQYYQDSKSKINNNVLCNNQSWNNDFDYEDPVDLEFLNKFQHNPDSNLNSSTRDIYSLEMG